RLHIGAVSDAAPPHSHVLTTALNFQESDPARNSRPGGGIKRACRGVPDRTAKLWPAARGLERSRMSLLMLKAMRPGLRRSMIVTALAAIGCLISYPSFSLP